MFDMVAELSKFVGQPPAGYEFLQYAALLVLLLMIVSSCITFLSGLFQLIGGR